MLPAETRDQEHTLPAPYKSVLLVGGTGFIPDCNITAITHEIPDLAIHYARNLTETLVAFDPAPTVLVVDQACLAQVTELDCAILEVHRHRVVAAVVESAEQTSGAVESLIAKGLLHSIFPMNLRLDTWLLVLRLLLTGYEHVPIPLMRSRLQDEAQDGGAGPAQPAPLHTALSALTERELQVLQMISVGNPNRIIADRFNLSEHTIKVHVHNIIIKLRARNRTAAAAMYLESFGRPRGTVPR